MELKKPYTIDEQIQQLKDHGLIINNEEFAQKILAECNYYRFTGYGLPFRKEPHDSDYVEGITFEQIYRLYLFDADLRSVLRRYLEIAEIYYRSQISYGFSIKKCVRPPHDQHYDFDNYYKPDFVEGIFAAFDREKGHNEDSKIVRHHENKYAGRMPLWVMVELLSFSNLSKLYSSMYLSEQNYIAGNVGAGQRELYNHLHCLSILRNKCAHGARLYGESLVKEARLNPAILRKNSSVRKDSLFAYVLVLHDRLPDQNIQIEFINDLNNVIKKYAEDIDLSQIGFPDSYYDILNYKHSQDNGGVS